MYVEEYINQTLIKIRTEGDESTIYPRNSVTPIQHDEVSLTISQDKSAIHEPSMNNQSQFLSFSLTSVLEESTDKEPSTSKRRHERVASDLQPRTCEDDKKPRDLPSFRKQVPNKREMPRLELGNIDSKTNLITLVHRNTDKKGTKVKISKSFREKENR